MDLPPLSDEPASAAQLAAALAALGLYDGTGTADEHATEAARPGGEGPYRMRLANALLGAVQVEAIRPDRRELTGATRVTFDRYPIAGQRPEAVRPAVTSTGPVTAGRTARRVAAGPGPNG
ncbi:DUF6245 family protein [Streptosporangium sandarakinum]|uniref:DUF6245 family protein n=1 Tax=Streptosporangium sandarakinum TaxID=1260955 RepID=UPI003D8AD799